MMMMPTSPQQFNTATAPTSSSSSSSALSFFDLSSYISRYDAHSETHLQRLLHIGRYSHFHPTNANDGGSSSSSSSVIRGDDGGSHVGNESITTTSSSNSSIAKQAYDLAMSQIKQSGNFHRYLEEYGAAIPMASMGDVTSSSSSSMAPEMTMPSPTTTATATSSTSSMMSPQRHHAIAEVSTHHNHNHSHDQQHHPIIQHYHPIFDSTFLQSSKQSAQTKLEILEGRLAISQSKLMKESIRSGLLALAMFHKEIGELREAWRRVIRSREYCTTATQHAQVTLLLLELCIDLRDWNSVHDTIARAERTVVVPSASAVGGGAVGGGGGLGAAGGGMISGGIGGGDGLLPSHDESHDLSLFHHKLKAAQGIAYLSENKYKLAAATFTSISSELTNQFSSVISAEDIALYGALLGWATLDREMVCAVVMDGVFKPRLELVPSMREALRHYSRAEYGLCLSYLQPGSSLRRDLEIDLHLHAHVPTLLDMIRDRCILQYFQPYSSVSLEKMGCVFGCSVKEMEEVVSKLISSGGMDGMKLGGRVRIDAHAKTLCVEDPAVAERRARRSVRVMAAKMGVQFKRNAEGMIMRVACISHGISAQDKTSGRANKGGRGRDMGGRTRSDRMGPDPLESDESDWDDAMDVDNHIVNPNEY